MFSKKAQRFGKWIFFRLQNEDGPYSVGSLKKELASVTGSDSFKRNTPSSESFRTDSA
jgi:hypothetical protein